MRKERVSIVRTKDRKRFALKSTDLDCLVGSPAWLNEGDMHERICTHYQDIWFYLIDQMYRDDIKSKKYKKREPQPIRKGFKS